MKSIADSESSIWESMFRLMRISHKVFTKRWVFLGFSPWKPMITTSLDFISRLVALVPRPRVNLTRYHSAGESDRTSYA